MLHALTDLLQMALSTLVDLVDRVGARVAGEGRWVAVEQADGGFTLFERKRGKLRPLGAFDNLDAGQRAEIARRSADTTELRIQSDRLMVASVKFPAGARGYVDKIIEHRLERLTPWRLDQIVYGYSIAGQPGPDGQHEATLTATSRDIVEETLTRFAATGLKPSILGSTADALDAPPSVDLLQGHGRRAKDTRRRVIGGAVLAVLAASMVFFVGSVWFNADAQRGLSGIEDELQALRARIASAPGAADNSPEARMLQQKTLATATFSLLNRLAAAIPPDTFLNGLEIQPAQIHLSGNSANASGLIDVLETRMGFPNATFEAPVARLPDGRDQFSIVATRQTAPGIAP